MLTDRGRCHGAGEVGVVVGLIAVDVVVVVCVLVRGAVVVLVVGVAPVVVVLAVDVGGVVFVTVVAGVGVVAVVVGLVFLLTFGEAPKNVVGWPLPVTERPARRSGTV